MKEIVISANEIEKMIAEKYEIKELIVPKKEAEDGKDSEV